MIKTVNWCHRIFWDKSRDSNIVKEKYEIAVKSGRSKNICYRMLQSEKSNRKAGITLL